MSPPVQWANQSSFRAMSINILILNDHPNFSGENWWHCDAQTVGSAQIQCTPTGLEIAFRR